MRLQHALEHHVLHDLAQQVPGDLRLAVTLEQVARQTGVVLLDDLAGHQLPAAKLRDHLVGRLHIRCAGEILRAHQQAGIAVGRQRFARQCCQGLLVGLLGALLRLRLLLGLDRGAQLRKPRLGLVGAPVARAAAQHVAQHHAHQQRKHQQHHRGLQIDLCAAATLANRRGFLLGRASGHVLPMISLRFGLLLRRRLLHVGLFALCFLRFRLLLRGLLLLNSIFFRCGLRLPAKPALLSFAHL